MPQNLISERQHARIRVGKNSPGASLYAPRRIVVVSDKNQKELPITIVIDDQVGGWIAMDPSVYIRPKKPKRSSEKTRVM